MTEKENHLPNLSSEERAHALELAMQARRRYAALKARVKSGELTFTDAMDEEDAKRIPRVLGFRASRKPRRKGMGKGAAAPPFPCLFCSRTDRISVLTGQGRSSSCKIWEVGTQSPLTWTFQPSSILLPSGFRSLDGRALSLEKTGNLGFPVFCSQQSDYPISCHLQMAAAQFAISVLRIMERRELRDA